MRILLVEDDEFIAKTLEEVLTKENYAIDIATNGEIGWRYIETFSYDLILLDVILPKLDGITLCRQLRSHHYQTPVLLITAQNSSSERINGLDAGADDYMTKPFEFPELLARMRVLLRRGNSAVVTLLECEDLRLNPVSCEVNYRDRLLHLTPKEYRLLELFLRNPQQAFSRGKILEHLWGSEDNPGEETVTSHMKGLRQKLKQAGAPGNLIETVYGMGYRLKQSVTTPTIAEPDLIESKERNRQIRAALQKVWKKFKDRNHDRLAILETAIANLQSNQLNPESHLQAIVAAHKLAGALGIFDLPQASAIAAEIEQRLRAQPNPDNTQQIAALFAALDAQIQVHAPAMSAEPEPIDTPSHDPFPLILHRIIQRIRQSLELSEILTTTVTEAREFLNTDRVKIYQFQSDGSGEVVAESIAPETLPSLIGHSFPAEDIPEAARTLFLEARQRSIVDIAAQQIGVSALEPNQNGEMIATDLRFRPVDSCHVDYLTAMGVKSSLVIPILDHDILWGLLVSHHSQPRSISETELQAMQLIADQVSIAIAQSNTLRETRRRAAHEAVINQVVSLLHSLPEMQLQEALEHAVYALRGSGGRLYIAAQNLQQPAQLFTYKAQPQLLYADPLEEHPYWQTWLQMEGTLEAGGWAIADVQCSMMPNELVTAFLAAEARGLLMIPLQYRQATLGYLSVFRRAIDIERVWAGRPDRDDPRQSRPRQSFETWREVRQNQAQPWTSIEIQLAQTLSHHFSVAIDRRGLHQRVKALNASLKKDIRKRKRAERELSTLNAALEQRVLERTEELQRLSHQHELILNSAGDGIYGLNIHGRITFINPAAARMLGYEVSDLIGQSMHTCFSHLQPDGTLHPFSKSPIHATLHDGTVQHRTGELFQRRDRSTFPVEYVSSPIEEQQKIVGAVIVFKDITERQVIEQMKDEFVSVVSHELRTPLTSIRSTLGLLSSGWLDQYPDKSQRMLDIASDNTNRLVRLISDILDVERIKFGKTALNLRLANVSDLIVQSADMMQAMAEKAGVTLSVTPVFATLWVDPDAIIQALTNLVNNAIKFSPAGGMVWINADRLDDQVLLSVRDQGIGIPEDKLEAIFDRFTQVDASNSRAQGGTGLGLTICRGIIQQHGGEIWVESQLGFGSAFYFTLPLNVDEG